MKKSIFSFLILMFALALPVLSQTYDSPVTEVEGASYIRYTGAAAITTTESTYTQAMHIGDANQGIGTVTLSLPDVTGTEDVNVFVEFSQDLLTWTSISAAVKDQLSTTAAFDSVHVVAGTTLIEFKGSVWMRLHFDGQTGNPTNTLTWSVFLPKNSGAPSQGLANAVNRRS